MLKQTLIILSILLNGQAYSTDKSLDKHTKSLISSQKKIDNLSKQYKDNLSKYYQLRKKIALTKAYQRWLKKDISDLRNTVNDMSRRSEELKNLKIDSIDILSEFTSELSEEPSIELSRQITQILEELSAATKISSEQIIINGDEKVVQISLGSLARFAVNPKKENCYIYKLGKWESIKGEVKTHLLLAYKKIKEHRFDTLSSFPIEVK